MKLIELSAQIENVSADALIYSTNQYLRLSGGVGASLLRKYGHAVQEVLDQHLRNRNQEIVPVGTIFEGIVPGMPWNRVFHTVATDLNYMANPIIVRRIVKICLAECAQDDSINSIVLSALGCGWGNMKYPDFTSILTEELESLENSDIFTVTLVNNEI